MNTRTPVRKVRVGPPRRGSEPDEKYKKWIRKQPCVVCDKLSIRRYEFRFLTIEAAHVGERGLGQTCPDRQCIPLCIEHHTAGPHSHHRVGKKFWAYWGLSRFELISKLNEFYDKERTK